MKMKDISEAKAPDLRASLAALQRAALQDLSYGSLRFYGQLRALTGLLLHKPMLDQQIYYVLVVALYQLQYSNFCINF